MSRPFKPPRLYLRRQRADRPAVWVIKCRGREIATGCAALDERGAQLALHKFAKAHELLGVTASNGVRVRGRGVRREARWGYIYIISAADDDSYPVKIGFTADRIATRFANIQSCNPIRLKILATIPCHSSAEIELHARLVPHLIFGEWYNRIPEINRIIETSQLER